MSSLLHLVGQLFLFCLLVIACGAVLRHVAMAAFGGGSRSPRATGGGRAKALRSPAPRAITAAGRQAGRSAAAVIAHPRNSTIRTQARADIRKMREEARLRNWLAGQEHARVNGTGGTATATATRPKPWWRRLRPFTPGPDDPSAGGASGPDDTPRCRCGATTDSSGRCTGCKTTAGQCTCAGYGGPQPAGQPANGGGTATAGTAGNGGSPASPSPPPDPAQPSQPASTNGGTMAGASTASAQKMIEGINEIQAHAQAGGLHGKREALAAIHEGAVRFSGMVQMLARQMSEPGMNYGHEITEPLAKAGQQFNAGAMVVGEAETAIETLINMTLGDLAKSPRQAPHHRELSEQGTR